MFLVAINPYRNLFLAISLLGVAYFFLFSFSHHTKTFVCFPTCVGAKVRKIHLRIIPWFFNGAMTPPDIIMAATGT